MEFFKFNGTDSLSINGLIIKEMSPIISAKRDIETIKIAGRNGNIHIDNGTYESYDISIVCILTDMSAIDTLKSLLQGTGILELSTVPNREFEATVMNQVDFSKYLTLLREFVIQFEISPISKSKVETIVTKTANGTFAVGGTFGISPILEIKGSGTGSIILNNTAIHLTDLSETAIIIDCDLMNATQGLNSSNSQINCDKFPSLIIGINNLTMIGITEIKIRYKEGWL